MVNRKCSACGTEGPYRKVGNAETGLVLKYCHQCGLHPFQKESDVRSWERYIELKHQWVKDHSLPLDDNFDGNLPNCDRFLQDGQPNQDAKCNEKGLCQLCLVRKAETTLPAIAAKQIMDEISKERGDGASAAKIREEEEADAKLQRRALHITCMTCGNVETERIGA